VGRLVTAPDAGSPDTAELTGLIARAHEELVAKGFSDDLATAAIKRATSLALKLGEALTPEIRAQGTLDLLRAELASAERWAESYRASLAE